MTLEHAKVGCPSVSETDNGCPCSVNAPVGLVPKSVDIEVVQDAPKCPEPKPLPEPTCGCEKKDEGKYLEVTLQQDTCCKKKEKEEDKPQWSCEKKSKTEENSDEKKPPVVAAASSHQAKQYSAAAQVDNQAGSGFSYGDDNDSIITRLFGW